MANPDETLVPVGHDVAQKRRREKDRVNYLRQHRDKLEKVAQQCVNRVLNDKPKDPYAALLQKLSEHTQGGMRFSHFRVWPKASDGGVCCEVMASARGAAIAVHRTELPRLLVARGLAAAGLRHTEGGAVDAVTLDEAERANVSLVASRLQSLLRGVLDNLGILEFDELHRRLCHLPGAERGASHAPAKPLTNSAALLRCVLGDVLLNAAGRLLGGTSLHAVQAALASKKLPGAVALQCQEDFQKWESEWPEFLLPAIRGHTDRRNLYIGVTVWAATLSEAVGGGNELVLVDEAAHISRRAAAEESRAEADVDEEEDQPDPDEFCPPLNCVPLAAKLGSLLAAKLGAECPSFPTGEDFAAALRKFRGALEVCIPSYVELELQSRAPGGEVNSTSKSHRNSVSSASCTDVESSMDAARISVAEQHRHGCVYCMLDVDAQSAFDPHKNAYTFSEGGEARTTRQLVDYYLGLCEVEPLLRGFVRPFSSLDPARYEGIRRLVEHLPAEVVMILDMDSAQGPEERAALEGEGLHRSPAVGFARDLQQDALGLLELYQEVDWLFSKKHGWYDFHASAERLSVIASYLNVSLGLPESGRKIALPKMSNIDELEQILQPLSSYLHGLFTTVYRQTRRRGDIQSTSGPSLTLPQFREGLRRLGYRDVELYAETMFTVLDRSNSGSLSARDLQALAHVKGPASLQEVDQFRVWLCEWQAARQRRKIAKAPNTMTDIGESVFAELVQRMDLNGSGVVKFNTFVKALRKMKCPYVAAGNDGHLRELFMCLDRKSKCSVSTQDVMDLAMFSARYQLTRVGHVRSFIRERFGSLRAAFKAMDIERSGAIKAEDWIEKMEKQYGFTNPEDLIACVRFIDKDGTRVLSDTDFDALGNFSESEFLKDLQLLHDQMVQHCGTLQEAWNNFGRRAANDEEVQAGMGLRAQGFLAGCQLMGFNGTYHPRLLFHFLDATHEGCLRRADFALLARLPVLAESVQEWEHMRAAFASFKPFGMRCDEGTSSVDQESRWLKFYEDLLASVQ